MEKEKSTVKYGQFEMPTEIESDPSSASSSFGRFVAEPLERCMGNSMGNLLRRMLLSSLEAPAIISVRFEGVPHEYMPIEGMVEDMTNVILNFKGALLRKLPTDEDQYARETRILTTTLEVTPEHLAETGQYAVTLSDVIKDETFEVVNGDHHLFSITKPLQMQIDLRVAFGRGYVPSERHDIEDKVTDEISIDACFSPVRLVNYWVENTRVGQHTDYDKLILEVTTDGRVTPTEALSFVSQIGIKHLEVFVGVEEKELDFDQISEEGSSDQEVMMQKLVQRIDEIELSVRSTNCLAGADIETIAELVVKPEPEMLRFRNFGKKSLTEIKNKLSDMGLSLGMDLSRFGITEENVKEVVAGYIEELSAEGL